jgi:hypothetical protein
MASARFSEALVVAVIEEKEGAGSAQYIEFKVHRSSTDPDLILGSWRFPTGNPVETVIAESRLGTSVEIEFRHVLDCADQHGIPFVWVNDPDELFLPFIR